MSDPQSYDINPDSQDLSEGDDAPPEANIVEAEAAVAAEFGEGSDASVRGASADPRFAEAITAEADDDDDEFSHLDPEGVVPAKLLREALDFFRAHRSSFANQACISVLDYSRSSRERRLHVVSLGSGEVRSLRGANGVKSEPVHNGFAVRFGNEIGSNLSSLGFVRAAETYVGKHGRSLRLDGLSSTNSNMRRRAVVVHGASYVTDAPVVQGRSNGCPAVPMSQKDDLITRIKGGSLMYFALSAP